MEAWLIGDESNPYSWSINDGVNDANENIIDKVYFHKSNYLLPFFRLTNVAMD